MNTTRKFLWTIVKITSLSAAFIACSVSGSLFAQSIPNLGEAAQFSVLAGSTVTNTGSSVITGELGVSPGTAITGFPPGIVQQGQIRSNDAVAAQAVADARVAYNNLAGQAVTTEQAAAMGSGMVLIPGVYHFTSAADITGSLVLDAQGSSTAVFVFQVEEALTLNNNAAISLINGATASNVFWQVGTSATLGTSSAFYGSILAGAGITLNTGATLVGRALAGTAVTLDSSTVTLAAASTGGTPTPTPTPTPVPGTELPPVDKVIDSQGQPSTAVIKAGATSNGGASYGSSFSTSEQIVVNGELTYEAGDVGKAASVFVVIKFTSTSGTAQWLMENGDGDFFAWDQNVESLVSMYSSNSIGTSIAGKLFGGTLEAGRYEVFIGYTAQGGALIYSETPMSFVVTQL